jgi:hypothetical protein
VRASTRSSRAFAAAGTGFQSPSRVASSSRVSSSTAGDHTEGGCPARHHAGATRRVALFTMGEGFHNNHHAAPTSARFSFRYGEFDPGWWLVSTLRWIRLANVRHDEIHLAA